MEKRKKVLVCPLNWGLGHATRCVPIIRRLVSEGHEVVIVGDGYPLSFLQKQFPQLRSIEVPSYPITYSKGNSQIWKFLGLIPKILIGIKKEHRWLDELLDKEHFDQVISDNRFGLWNKKTHSIYITHQVMIKMPKGLKWLEPIVYKLHRHYIDQYNTCWIPDREADGGLSGDLSHKYPVPPNAKFIGTLSRFDKFTEIEPNTEYQTIVILSGVEPQRSIFEKRMVDKFKDTTHKTLILQGKPAEDVRIEKIRQIDLISHLNDEKFVAILKGCKEIICRAGYSTVMDLDTLQVLNKARFYPTPGQTEQEYLAEYLCSRATGLEPVAR
ncbi:MAG TPA: glycosyltransferase [Bacteroidales bacterium]|nr:glycosyltransferase [Bacteroidales bacterium]